MLLTSATEAEARARSSGGYSRPSMSFSRTPSFSTSRSVPRTPSTSGGYFRPSPAPSRPSFRPAPSAGDLSVSRQRSSSALDAYRAQQNAARPPPAASSSSSYAPPSGWGRTPSPVIRPAERPGWYSQRGWNLPSYYPPAARSFGIWDGLFLWALLSNLSRPGSAEWFHNHQNDPGYQEWRAEAERQARDNADLRARLNELDRTLATRAGQPVDPDYLPPDIPPAVATAAQGPDRTPSVTQETGDSTPWVLIAVIAGIGVLGWAMWSRIKERRSAGGGTMSGIQSAGAMLRHKLSGEQYTPQFFRVGMTFPYDPTPFVLASGATKVVSPVPQGGNLTVTAVGDANGGGTRFTRLYLPDDRSMFQIHTDAGGRPDECRFFSRIDQITPADPQEWAFWLDPAQGMIGWPQFQTKDGRMYDRVWSPGGGRIAPLGLTETVTDATGTHERRSRCMLYAAPTNAARPAPQAEYILVSAMQAGDEAWVEIAAGIDVNPGLLNLS